VAYRVFKLGQEADEKDLFERIQKGDEVALELIYKKYYRMMTKMVISNSGTEEEARDVYQDALVVFWQKARSGNLVLTSKMSTYIYSICQNLWRKELDRKKRLSNEEKDMGEMPDQDSPEREKIIAEARQESEGIILKAQGMKDIIRKELEKESKIKIVRTSVDILNRVFSEKAKDALNETLLSEFLTNLKDTDMSRISVDIREVEIVTASSLSSEHRAKFSTLLKDKLKRDVSLKESVDPNIGGGASLRFGSMALDGSIRNLILEESGRLLQKVEIES
jgi:F0F1-type ATP synthase delta subunit